jgi:hypothetical protein
MKSELLPDNKMIIRMTFEELENNGHSSVTDYCRELVENFGYQTGTLENTTIEVYRGEMKCLIVNDIKEAAMLEPAVDKAGWRKYRVDKRGRKAVGEFK